MKSINISDINTKVAAAAAIFFTLLCKPSTEMQRKKTDCTSHFLNPISSLVNWEEIGCDKYFRLILQVACRMSPRLVRAEIHGAPSTLKLVQNKNLFAFDISYQINSFYSDSVGFPHPPLAAVVVVPLRGAALGAVVSAAARQPARERRPYSNRTCGYVLHSLLKS